jgi:hypothetical protein
MQFAYLEMLSPGMLRIALTMVVVVMAAFTIIGPIGTYILIAPLDRLVHAVVIAFFTWPIYYSLSVMTVYLARFRSPRQVGLAVVLVMLVASLPGAAVLYTFQALFYPEYFGRIGFLTIYVMSATASVACQFLLHYILCQRVRHAPGAAPDRAPASAGSDTDAAGAVGRDGTPDQALGQSAGAPPAAAPTSDSPPPTTTPPAAATAGGDSSPPAAKARTPFFSSLSLDPGGDLILLKTEGRYVQVYTTTGTSRVIARFADVVAQLGDLGMQVHRSYWVSHRYTTELVKRDTHTLVRLTDGQEIPVSRTYLAAVRAAMRAAAS